MRYICYDCEPPCCLDIGSNCECYKKVTRCPIQGLAHWLKLQEPTEEKIQAVGKEVEE